MPRGQYQRTPRETAAPEPEVGDMPQSVAPINEDVSPRASEVRRERRRRDDGDIDRMMRLSLHVPREVEDRLKREGKVHRWFLDKPGRLAEAHDDDWDVVEGVHQVAAGQEDEEKMVLMSKFKDWHDEDVSAEQRLINEREKAMVSAASTENRRADDGLIVPEGQRNRISRNRG